MTTATNVFLTQLINPQWTTTRNKVQQITNKDLLALSVAWKRLRDSGTSHNIGSITDESLSEHLTTTDIEQAAVIKDYYSKKIMLWNIKGQQISKFRTDLTKIIYNQETTYCEADLPILYRLPEFYEYDTNIDSLKNRFNVSITDANQFGTKKLNPLQHLKSKINGVVWNEYWLADSKNNANVIKLRSDNQLQSLWDREFAKESLLIEGSYIAGYRDDLQFYRISKWTIA